MRSSQITLLAAIMLLCCSAVARATELTATDAQVDQKRVTLSFRLSENAQDIEKVFDYGANIVKIKVPGLSFSSAQLKGDKLKVKDEHGENFYRFTRFSKIEGGGMITVYLGKLCSPADALVVPGDSRISVEIIKPTWKLDSPPADTAPPANNTPPANTTPPADTHPVDPPQQPADNGSDPPSDNTKPDPPAFDNSNSHSYKKFDLSQVPASKVEIKDIPFNEAIMLIVADSGFNVVVGEGVDRTKVMLNFTQKGISLESALDILCMAYELKYTVDDDAIIISRR